MVKDALLPEQTFLLTGCVMMTGMLMMTVVDAETLGSLTLVAVMV
jgi:hypothetical protein